jgi:hypothetical protein
MTWQGRNPLSPVVRLTGTSSMALLQNWAVILPAGIGITGSLLAGLLIEWLRRPTSGKYRRRQRPGAPAHASR